MHLLHYNILQATNAVVYIFHILFKTKQNKNKKETKNFLILFFILLFTGINHFELFCATRTQSIISGNKNSNKHKFSSKLRTFIALNLGEIYR